MKDEIRKLALIETRNELHTKLYLAFTALGETPFLSADDFWRAHVDDMLLRGYVIDDDMTAIENAVTLLEIIVEQNVESFMQQYESYLDAKSKLAESVV